MSNPLVAVPKNDTTAVTGIGIAESAADLANGISDGSWVEAGLGAAGVGLEVLSMVIDPVGTVASYGVGWLIEHVQPLKEALDWFAGDPPVIRSFSETWATVAAEVGRCAGELGRQDAPGWRGTAADAYRGHATHTADAIAGAATLADGVGTGVMVMGEVVAAVREIIRDLVAEVVGKLITWALEAVATLGLATPLIVAQAASTIARVCKRVSDLVRKLVKTIGNVTPLIRKVLDKLGDIMRKLDSLGHRAGSPDAPVTRTADAPSAPDAPTVGGVDGATSPSSASATTTSPSGTGTPSGDTSPSGTSPADGDARAGTGATSEPPKDSRNPAGSTKSDDPKADARERECVPGSGDPVDLLTGQMFTTQVDVRLPGTLPLVLQRTHFSEYRRGRHFGRSWASTLDQRIELSGTRVRFADDQGVRLEYPLPGVNGDPVLPVEGPRWPLRQDGDGFHIHQPGSGRTVHFPTPSQGQTGVPISAISDRNGARIDVDRDAGIPVAVRHSGGYHIDIDSAGGLVTELRLRGTTGPVVLVRYRYDDAENLVQVVNSSGQAHRFDYDPEGRVVRWVDRNGEWYRYRYDDQGRVVRTEGSGDALAGTWQYDAGTTRYTNSLGHTATYVFNESGQMVREVDTLGNETRREWDRYNRLLSRTDPLGRTTRYDHDADGHITAITRPDGSRSLAEYDTLGLRTKVTDPDGSTWRYEYDAKGNLVTATDPADARTRYAYDEHGNLSTVTDSAGATTTVATGGAGLPIAVTAPDGAVTRYVRDDFGRVSSVVDPLGGTTRFGWSVEGAPLWRTLPDGTTERWHHDGEGNRYEQVSPTGAVTRTETTHFDMPASRSGPDGARLEFAYDTELRLTTVVNAHGATWHYQYDPAGRLISETDFNGRTVTYAYDAAGQLVATTNGAAETTRLERDLLGNIVVRDAGGRVSRFEYDPVGRLTRAVNDDADVVFELDALGHVVAEVVDGRRLANEFDALGRRTHRVTPSGVRSTWSYDAAGRPSELRTAGRTMSFRHDALGRELERRLDTGILLTQAWAPGNRLARQTVTAAGDDVSAGRLVQQRSYGYLPDGTLAEVDDLLAGPRRYGVDPAGRVTDVLAAGRTEHYSYDATGNIVQASGPWDEAGSREHTGTLVRRAGNVHHRYDAQGRVVMRQHKRPSAKSDTWHYAWDAEDRLVAVTTPDGTRWRYRYDALGRRVAKQRLDPTGAVAEETRFAWDGLVLAEQTTAGGHTTTWDFEPGGFRPLTQTERRPDTGADQSWIDEQYYAIVTDLVGTPTETIDEAGDVAWQARATVWGRTEGDPDTPGHTPLRFPGQYHDPETGLHYNYRRYYDPTTGRYASGDPLGLAAAPDPHSYVPNPTTWADPLGLAGKKCETGDTETFYRGMSRAEYENQVRAQNSLFPLHGETFVTQDVDYIEQLAARHPGQYEVLVRFDMEPGTRDALLAAGARDDPASRTIRTMGLDNLPVLSKGNGQVHIKGELEFLNFGLRRDSVGIFNDRISGHEIIREFGS